METRPLVPRRPDSPHVPVIGMGSSKTLDTDDLDLAGRVVSSAFEAGTRVFDSSPMYGKAERVLGGCLAPRRGEAVVLTKVWTDDDTVAVEQIDRSLEFFGGHLELLQIHNMVRWRTRLEQIEARRAAGQVDFVGATHWQHRSFGDVEAAMATGRIDAVQLPYNPVEREVERRLLPMAADMGIGVVIMRPFADGALLRNPPPAPELAAFAAFGITTWAQALLSWGLSHPATTVSIPATSRPERAAENAGAGGVRWLDDEHRARLTRLFLA